MGTSVSPVRFGFTAHQTPISRQKHVAPQHLNHQPRFGERPSTGVAVVIALLFAAFNLIGPISRGLMRQQQTMPQSFQEVSFKATPGENHTLTFVGQLSSMGKQAQPLQKNWDFDADTDQYWSVRHMYLQMPQDRSPKRYKLLIPLENTDLLAQVDQLKPDSQIQLKGTVYGHPDFYPTPEIGVVSVNQL